MQCVYLSAIQPSNHGELRIFNQLTETFSVNQLADQVRCAGEKLGYQVRKEHIENPRIEKEDHYYNPKYTGLIELGLKPHYLTDNMLDEFFRVVEMYKDRINQDVIFRGVKWR